MLNHQTDTHVNPYGIPPCTGSSVCGLSCCKGWDIAFTDEDKEKLKALDEAYISMAGTYTGEGGEKTCAFLLGDGRCVLYAQHGKASLPALCFTYPEGKGVFGGVVEYAPDPGCPEVALRLMSENNHGIWESLTVDDRTPLIRLELTARQFLTRLLFVHPYRFFHIKMKIIFGVLFGMRELMGKGDFDEGTLNALLSFYEGLEDAEENRLIAEEYGDFSLHGASACRKLYRLFHTPGDGAFLLHLLQKKDLMSRAEELLKAPGALRDALASFSDSYGEALHFFPYNFMELALYRDVLTEVPGRFGERFLSMCVIYSMALLRMVLLHDGGQRLGRRDLAVQVSILSRAVYHSPYAVRLIAEHLKANGFLTPDNMLSLIFTPRSER